jgi:hypothetical protein
LLAAFELTLVLVFMEHLAHLFFCLFAVFRHFKPPFRYLVMVPPLLLYVC